MTTDKLYELRAELECALGLLEKNPDNYRSACSLSRLIEKVNAEIAAANAKGTGRMSTLAAVKRILKVCASGSNTALKYASIQNGYQYICDGYRLIALSEPLAGLPEMPDNVTPLDYSKIDREPLNPVMLTPPTLGELKNWIKQKNAEHKATGRRDKFVPEYHFGPGCPTVNAAYLADMLEALPDASIVYENGQPLKGIRLTSDNGHGILMGIRTNEPNAIRTNFAT